MLDIQVIKSRQLLAPQTVAQVPGIEPPVLEIRGSNFNTVVEMRLNSVIVTDFLIASNNQILATVPKVMRGAVIKTVEIISGLPVQRQPAKLFFEFGQTPTTVSGLQKLIQQVVSVLLTTPGSDIFEPNLGGGFLAKVGSNVSPKNMGSLMTDLAEGLSRTQSQLIAIQSQSDSIPDDERLLSLDIGSSSYDAQSTSIFVLINVLSVAGSDATAELII